MQSELHTELASAVQIAIAASFRSGEWHSARLQITAIGLKLNAEGGIKAMHEALNAIADRYDDPEYARVCGVIDKRFDGIGGWMA